jgi:hypothetical protein
MANRGGEQFDIDDINDIRNGLLLCQSLHTVLGLGQVAFLKVVKVIIESRMLADF